MAKIKSQKDIKRRINELKIIKRSGILRAVIAIVGMAALIAAYLYFETVSSEFGSNIIIRGMLFITALVAAGFAGFGTRQWKRAKDEIVALEKKLK